MVGGMLCKSDKPSIIIIIIQLYTELYTELYTVYIYTFRYFGIIMGKEGKKSPITFKGFNASSAASRPAASLHVLRQQHAVTHWPHPAPHPEWAADMLELQDTASTYPSVTGGRSCSPGQAVSLLPVLHAFLGPATRRRRRSAMGRPGSKQAGRSAHTSAGVAVVGGPTPT